MNNLEDWGYVPGPFQFSTLPQLLNNQLFQVSSVSFFWKGEQRAMLEMFAIQHTSIWPNFILIGLRIQKKQAAMLSSNAYDDVTDFEIGGFHNNTKI